MFTCNDDSIQNATYHNRNEHLWKTLTQSDNSCFKAQQPLGASGMSNRDAHVARLDGRSFFSPFAVSCTTKDMISHN
jgi:hypothetical protein